MSFKKYVLAIIPLLFLLTACTGTIAEEQDKAVDEVKVAFQESDIKPNNKIDDISLYLPTGMDVESSEEYNILLSDGAKRYLLFINPVEESNSKNLYESTLQTIEEPRVNKTFDEKGSFGYIIVSDVEEELYEVTVGMGGIKMTTETDVANLAHESRVMMEVVKSITIEAK